MDLQFMHVSMQSLQFAGISDAIASDALLLISTLHPLALPCNLVGLVLLRWFMVHGILVLLMLAIPSPPIGFPWVL